MSDFIHKTASMREWVYQNVDFYKPLTGKITPEIYSELAWSIYSEYIKHTRYITDKLLYGTTEQWTMPSSNFYMKQRGFWWGDCECHANLCASLIRSVLPRGLVRVVAGNTTGEYGHATLTVWDWRTNKFEQWETTAYEPIVSKPEDNFYVKNVWFSYDDEYSWSYLNKKKYDIKDILGCKNERRS